MDSLGHQILKLIDDHFYFNDVDQGLIQVGSSFSLQMKENESLDAFLNRWDKLYIQLRTLPDEPTLEYLFRKNPES